MPEMRIPLIKINQWLQSWENAEWSTHLPRPSPHFYIASISLLTLRRLAGVSTRNVIDRVDQTVGGGYQRAHQPSRSKSIARYLQVGYPLSSQSSLDVEKYRNLIHPGWLPTSILVNVVGEGETRRRSGQEKSVAQSALVKVVEENGSFFLEFPLNAGGTQFSVPPDTLEPIEVIDGQHRLFAVDALDGEPEIGNYEVPVVIFDRLSPSWQAYLFWVINVEPKKINPSLAYDLYPELRNQSWLQGGEGIRVYQEHRAQELTEVLWRHSQSPWKNRIELHGSRVPGHVSNAAFIRALMASFVRRWGAATKIGGLFGSIEADAVERVLPWKRAQQAAFLIACWRDIANAVASAEAQWIVALAGGPSENNLHAGFAGEHTLLGTDQGVRAISAVLNALHQVVYENLELEAWDVEEVEDEPDDDEVSTALASLERLDAARSYMRSVASALVLFVDWRTSSAPGLTAQQKLEQSIFRGSSGYVLLQDRCFEALSRSDEPLVVQSAATATEMLKR